MARYEPMFSKSTDQPQDGTNEPDQDGFGDKYDIIIKCGGRTIDEHQINRLEI